MLGRDGIAGLICLAISLGLFALTFELPSAVMVPVGPAFYPRVVILIFGLLSAVLIALDLFSMHRLRAGTTTVPGAAPAAAGEGPNYRLVLATFVEFGLYIALMPLIGFRLSTFLVVYALQVTLEWPRTHKHWALAVAVAIAATLLCFFIFEDYLSVLLPRGTWSGM
jgi:hypothetical protein